ncbi:DMT family transporter [Flexibacterium corallicola]|uniref:DMT family transporter n=1 Tax=Flexibacterium corallicola TaxID=3037259 RepID=UPI00286FA916|nr:DMT family transporter [Pseudovibrio sp. M1P-2-3]
MEFYVFVAVIAAAFLHALWNSLVKGGSDKYLGMSAVVLGHVPFALLALLFVPLPALESIPYILAGIVLHTGYQIFLLYSYKLGDLTQVYPMARGTAPLLVAGVSVLFLGEVLAGLELLAVFTIAAGILSISLERKRSGARNNGASILAFITGCFIASYSLIDGMGARISGNSLSFYSILSLGNSLLFFLIMLYRNPLVLKRLVLHNKLLFLGSGLASYVAYALVIWAFTLAPIALVTALRETSIIFALVIGTFVLKESISVWRVFSTMMTLMGAALLRFAK